MNFFEKSLKLLDKIMLNLVTKIDKTSVAVEAMQGTIPYLEIAAKILSKLYASTAHIRHFYVSQLYR